MPKISIITPTYNRKELLVESIESVLKQKQDIPFEWEMIIIDDGSTDGTEAHIQPYCDNHKNIIYTHIENVGMNNARNKGFDMMSSDSDYMIMLDSDDTLLEDCIYTCLTKFETLRSDGVYDEYLGLFFFAEDEEQHLIGNRSLLDGRKQFDIDYDYYLSGFLTFEPGFIFKSSFFLDTNNRFDYDIPSGGTGVLWAKWWKEAMGKEGKKFLFFDYIGRMYRQNNNGRLTFEFTKNTKRFLENALSGDRILEITHEDMLSHGYINLYGDMLWRIGVNYLLGGSHMQGQNKIAQSLQYKKSVLQILLLGLSKIAPSLIYTLYTLYVRFEYRFLKS